MVKVDEKIIVCNFIQTFVMKLLNLIFYLADPCKVIACYSVFLVVRAAENDDSQQEEEEDFLFTHFCPDHNADLSLGLATDIFTGFDFLDEEKPLPWIKEDLLQDINVKYEVIPEEVSPYERPDTQWWGKVFTPQPLPLSRCEDQVEHYLRDLQHFELWAIQMWDANAKPAAGLLSGNSNQLGDYDSCLAVELAALGAVEGKYCLADVDLEATDTALPSVRAAIHKLQAGAFIRSKHSDPGHFAPRFTTLHWGLCVPAACSDEEVQSGLRHFLQDYQLPGVVVDSVIKPGMCYTNQRDTTLPLLTIITLGFFGGILMLAVVSTMVDSNCDFPQMDKLRARDRALLAFSLRRNLRTLMSRQSDELPVIHGVRSFFTILLFAAHKLMPLSLTPYSNRGFLTQCSHSALSAVLRAASLFTDCFLLLSAVLVAYNLGRELRRNGFIPWRLRVLARFIRLTPSLLAVVLFYAYVMEHLGNGPQWTSSITANADLCKKNLWKNLLYIHNFFQFEDMCAPHTYQLALDTQLFLVALVVVYCLHFWSFYSLLALGVFQLAVTGLRYFTHLHYQISAFIYHNVSLTDLYLNANMSYTQAIHRATPYLVGLLTGFFLQRVGKIQLTQIQAVLGWILCLLFASVSIFYPSHLSLPDAVYDETEGALYSAVSPLLWSMALAWFIVACSSGYGGWLHKVMCQHWMVVLSRLSYSIYLTQFIIFFHYVGSLRTSQEFSLLYAVGLYEVVGVLLTSLLVTLLFDLPMQEMKNILLPGRRVVKVNKVS